MAVRGSPALTRTTSHAGEASSVNRLTQGDPVRWTGQTGQVHDHVFAAPHFEAYLPLHDLINVERKMSYVTAEKLDILTYLHKK